MSENQAPGMTHAEWRFGDRPSLRLDCLVSANIRCPKALSVGRPRWGTKPLMVGGSMAQGQGLPTKAHSPCSTTTTRLIRAASPVAASVLAGQSPTNRHELLTFCCSLSIGARRTMSIRSAMISID